LIVSSSSACAMLRRSIEPRLGSPAKPALTLPTA
jgi:hypothetical protein